MKKLSRKTVEEAAGVLNLGIRFDSSLYIKSHDKDISIRRAAGIDKLFLGDLGIELEPCPLCQGVRS